ncbi:hypothetical protein JR334_10835 [Clostridia bacterium]|nr:hypothetical protein JR334_10835 [Clostridia bacterium]
MKKYTKILLMVSLVFLLICPTIPCLANSAEPPSITIITKNPPDDLELTLTVGDQVIEARTDDKILEQYFSFYASSLKNEGAYLITMSLDGEKSSIKIEDPPNHYNNIYTLDWEKGTLTPGKAPFRSAKLVGLRVSFTLLLEALVFFLFGFREYKSWTFFLFINLITQGILNIWLGSHQLLGSYIVFALVFGEIFVYLAELISFVHVVKEKSTLRRVLYVLLANTLSLVAGGYLISLLPL